MELESARMRLQLHIYSLLMIPFFFFLTNRRSVEELKRILTLYEDISGQKINFDKSELCLSRNDDRIWISEVMNVTTIQCHGKYLGMPFIYGANKRVAFSQLIAKYQNSCTNWSNKILSIAGKEILIKTVLQSLLLT